MKPSETLAGIRIARISTVPFFVVAQLKHQIATLGAHGGKVSVVTSDEPEMSLLHGLSGVTCVAIDIPRSIAPWRDLLALIRLYQFFRRERIQIAHSTTPKAGLLVALAAYFAGVPIRLHTFTGQPWVTMRGIKRWLARASDKLIGKLNTCCYADSISQKQYLITQGVLDERKLSVIGAGSLAGVDVQRFYRNRFTKEQCEALRRSLGIPQQSPVVLFVGRITEDKGVYELLRAFSAIKAAGSVAHLVFVGRFDTDSGVAGSIKPDDIERIPDTHLVGHTESPEKYMAIADVLCLPSYREGFGTVVIEAAAMGIPAIGTKIYGLIDAIEDGVTGLLVPPKDVDALSKALEMICNNAEFARDLGEKARYRAYTLFDSEITNSQVISEYLSLLSTAGLRTYG